MLRLILFLVAVGLAAAGLAWLADRPGELLVEWQGYQIETSVFRAIILLAVIIVLALVAWTLLRHVWHGPANLGGMLAKRRQQQGLDALSSGMIALGAGDKSAAMRAALQARKSLPNEPLTHLLRAQAAQLTGDRTTARRIFEAMLANPDTEQLGLRGLFLEAQRVGETEAARHFAERAVQLNPKLNWAVDALFELQCRQGDWAGALDTLGISRKNGHIEKKAADRRRAVLLTAQAQEAEEADPERALNLSLEAHGLAPDLVPASAIAGRLLAARGNTPRAAKVLRRTWTRSPHPELSTAYAYARIGDSPRDRLDRAKQLSALTPGSLEGPIAVAAAAIEARQYDEARVALEPLIGHRLTQRVATLMARIEGERGDKGRVREWLARAVSAARDPAWTADGIVAERWAPTSPATGTLDAFQWRVPVEMLDKGEPMLPRDLQDLLALGGGEMDEAPVTAHTINQLPAGGAEEDTRATDKAGMAARSSVETGRETGRSQSASRETRARTDAQREDRTAAEGRAEKRTEKGTEGRIERRTQPTRSFPPPHAPDDPGPDDGSEMEDLTLPLRPKPA
jgi:HemY protein